MKDRYSHVNSSKKNLLDLIEKNKNNSQFNSVHVFVKALVNSMSYKSIKIQYDYTKIELALSVFQNISSYYVLKNSLLNFIEAYNECFYVEADLDYIDLCFEQMLLQAYSDYYIEEKKFYKKINKRYVNSKIVKDVRLRLKSAKIKVWSYNKDSSTLAYRLIFSNLYKFTRNGFMYINSSNEFASASIEFCDSVFHEFVIFKNDRVVIKSPTAEALIAISNFIPVDYLQNHNVFKVMNLAGSSDSLNQVYAKSNAAQKYIYFSSSPAAFSCIEIGDKKFKVITWYSDRLVLHMKTGDVTHYYSELIK